jgi:hypothetical protein
MCEARAGFPYSCTSGDTLAGTLADTLETRSPTEYDTVRHRGSPIRHISSPPLTAGATHTGDLVVARGVARKHATPVPTYLVLQHAPRTVRSRAIYKHTQHIRPTTYQKGSSSLVRGEATRDASLRRTPRGYRRTGSPMRRRVAHAAQRRTAVEDRSSNRPAARTCQT